MTFKRNYYIEDFTDPKTFMTLFLGSWVPGFLRSKKD